MAAYICSASMNSVVGCIFRHLRNISDVGQLEIAEITKLPTSTISKIESGSINITIELCFMLCSYYQISFTEFFRILETAIESLYDDKVFIYLTKTESVTIKEHTISIDKTTSRASAGALSEIKTALTSDSLVNHMALGAAVGVAGAAGGMIVAPVVLGAGALLAITNPILGALSIGKEKKGSRQYERLIETTTEKKISGGKEATEEEMIDLPILSAKQIYAILKDTLNSLPIENLSQEQKNLYKIFAEKANES